PTAIPPERVAELRARIAGDSATQIIGHFGTFGTVYRSLLAKVWPALLGTDGRRKGLLIGRGAATFREELVRQHQALAVQLEAADGLPPEAVSTHLAACDLLLQPYPDGGSTRRGSLMAGLALGRPTLTNLGILSEEIWTSSGAVALAAAFEPEAFLTQAEELL